MTPKDWITLFTTLFLLFFFLALYAKAQSPRGARLKPGLILLISALGIGIVYNYLLVLMALDVGIPETSVWTNSKITHHINNASTEAVYFQGDYDEIERPSLVFYMSPSCPDCKDIYPELREWVRRNQNLPIYYIESGTSLGRKLKDEHNLTWVPTLVLHGSNESMSHSETFPLTILKDGSRRSEFSWGLMEKFKRNLK